MALVYNNQFKNSTKIGDKEIKFRAWTTKDEKDFLIAKDSLEDIDDNLLYDILVTPCLEDNTISLSPLEKKKLILEIRKVSLGSTFPMKYSCVKCKSVNDLEVDLDDITTFKEPNFGSIEVQDIKFNFSAKVSQNLYKRLEEEKNLINKAFIELLIHIESIVIDGKVEDDFSFDELYEYMESLPSSVFDELYPKFKEMKGYIEFNLKTKCLICNNDNIVDFDHLPNFLWA